MKHILFLFLFPFFCFSQSIPIELKIDFITSKDINFSHREYQINYQIENKTNNEISFFLIPNALIANAASSLTLFPVYKMFQNGVFEDMDGPFFEYESEDMLKLAEMEDFNSVNAKTLINKIKENYKNTITKYNDDYKKNGGESADNEWIFQNQRLLNNIVVLKPNETKQFIIKTLWNKNRFIKNEDLEFYLDEKNKIEIELILELKTNLFKNQLSVSDLEKINTNPNFISGTFTSNKMEVQFKD